MEGKETYRFATKTLASSALAAIRRAGLRPDEIDLVIPHQANIRIIEAVAKGLGFPWSGSSSTSTATEHLRRVVPWPSPSFDAGRWRSGIASSSSPSGRLHLRGGGPRVDGRSAAGARAASIRPEEIPSGCRRLDTSTRTRPSAAILAAPGPVEVPLDDVVPGEPAAKEVPA